MEHKKEVSKDRANLQKLGLARHLPETVRLLCSLSGQAWSKVTLDVGASCLWDEDALQLLPNGMTPPHPQSDP